MDIRDQQEDRALFLLESIKCDLLALLKNAPEYGSCGIDFSIHNSEILRVGIRTEIARKAKSRIGIYSEN
jgi:hypothetical protein